MEGTQQGGRAFPQEYGDDGMFLRDYFAAAALTGMLQALHEGIRPADVSALCRDAYGIGSEMLRARQQ